MNSQLEIPIAKVAPELTVTVKVRGVRGYMVRFWIGSRLIRLAAWILQCNVVIEGREA